VWPSLLPPPDGGHRDGGGTEHCGFEQAAVAVTADEAAESDDAAVWCRWRWRWWPPRRRQRATRRGGVGGGGGGGRRGGGSGRLAGVASAAAAVVAAAVATISAMVGWSRRLWW